MTTLHAHFLTSGALAWSMTTSGEAPHKAGSIPAAVADPLAELRHLELCSGVGRVELTVSAEQPLTPAERAFAAGWGWKII